MDTISYEGIPSHTVYALIDPRTDEIRYIGISNNAPLRLKSHLACDGSNPSKDEWIQELKANQCELIMKILEMVDGVNEARKREQHWIHHYHLSGASLFNREVWDASNGEPAVKSRDKRDREKYAYLTIVILRESLTFKDLQSDAEEHGTKHLPTIAGMRLSEYYRLKRQGLSVIPAAVPREENKSHSSVSTALSNAAEANDAWPE